MRKYLLALTVAGWVSLTFAPNVSACCFFCCKKSPPRQILVGQQPGSPGGPTQSDELKEPVKPKLVPVPEPLPKLKAPPEKLPGK